MYICYLITQKILNRLMSNLPLGRAIYLVNIPHIAQFIPSAFSITAINRVEDGGPCCDINSYFTTCRRETYLHQTS